MSDEQQELVEAPGGVVFSLIVWGMVVFAALAMAIIGMGVFCG